MGARLLLVLAAGTAIALAVVACLPSFSCFTEEDHCGGGGASNPEASVEASADARGWQRVIHVHTGTSGVPVGYTVRVEAFVDGGHAPADGTNVHVIGANAEDLDRVVDPPTVPTRSAIWFALGAPIQPGTDDTTYSLVYGDPDAGVPPADGAAVFTSYADFTGPPPDAGWKTQGPVTFGLGGMLLKPAGADGGATAESTSPPPHASNTGVGVEIFAQLPVVTTNGPAAGYYSGDFWLGFQATVGSCPYQIWGVTNVVTSAVLQPRYCVGTGSTDMAGQATTSNYGFAPHSFRIDRSLAQTSFFIDDKVQLDAALSDTTEMPVVIRALFTNGDQILVTLVRARDVVVDEPQVTLDPEKPYP
ncbi:MAG TPA: hypothetical protein VF765_20105 [Polyangiaceae bacterium]